MVWRRLTIIKQMFNSAALSLVVLTENWVTIVLGNGMVEFKIFCPYPHLKSLISEFFVNCFIYTSNTPFNSSSYMWWRQVKISFPHQGLAERVHQHHFYYFYLFYIYYLGNGSCDIDDVDTEIYSICWLSSSITRSSLSVSFLSTPLQ